MSERRRKMTNRGMVIGAVVGVLAFLYFSGRLDPTLYHVGLNFNECGQNGFGTVYCGDSLDEYNRRVESALPATAAPQPPSEIEENEAAYEQEREEEAEARRQQREEAKHYGRELKAEECEAVREAGLHNATLEASLCAP